MSDEAGISASAIAVTQDALSAHYGAVTASDHTLAAALTEAHSITVAALRRLDSIEAEVESAVARQHLLALDTPTGMWDFQRFLLAKQRDITALVAEAVDQAEAKAGQMQRLLGQYRARGAAD